MQEYCSGLPFPSPRDLPNPGFEPGSPALQIAEPPGKLRLKEAVPLRRLVPRTNRGGGTGRDEADGEGRSVEKEEHPTPRPLQASPNHHSLRDYPPNAACF